MSMHFYHEHVVEHKLDPVQFERLIHLGTALIAVLSSLVSQDDGAKLVALTAKLKASSEALKSVEDTATPTPQP